MVSKPIVASWKALSKGLQTSISKESFDTWFKHLDVSEWSGGSVRLIAPNRYVKQWIESHYLRELLDAAREIQPETRTVEIVSLPPRKPVKSATPVGNVLNGNLPRVDLCSFPHKWSGLARVADLPA
jgi:chromosomal replication initiator protein